MVIVIMELLLHHVCREIVGTGQETRKLYELAKRTMISTKMARVHADWELFLPVALTVWGTTGPGSSSCAWIL